MQVHPSVFLPLSPSSLPLLLYLIPLPLSHLCTSDGPAGDAVDLLRAQLREALEEAPDALERLLLDLSLLLVAEPGVLLVVVVVVLHLLDLRLHVAVCLVPHEEVRHPPGIQVLHKHELRLREPGRRHHDDEVEVPDPHPLQVGVLRPIIYIYIYIYTHVYLFSYVYIYIYIHIMYIKVSCGHFGVPTPGRSQRTHSSDTLFVYT